MGTILNVMYLIISKWQMNAIIEKNSLTVYFLLKKCRRIKVKLTKDKCIKKCLDKKCILLFRFEDNSNLYYQFYLLCNFMKFSWLSNVTGYETSWFIHQVVAI